MHVVTTFAESGWHQYGRDFIESFLRFWPERCVLHVFLEGQDIPGSYPKVVWHDLAHDREHQDFCSRYAGPQYNHPTDWNEMSVKFCHKVFAITSHDLPMEGWRFWIDADVVTQNPVSDGFLAAVAPVDKALTFLGRRGMMRPGQPAYTECGFVGYNTDFLSVRSMLSEMRLLYTSGKLFQLGRHNQHDSYAFDWCRKAVGIGAQDENDLAALCKPGTFHPWPSTILGQFMLHHKGPRRKAEAYGTR